MDNPGYIAIRRAYFDAAGLIAGILNASDHNLRRVGFLPRKRWHRQPPQRHIPPQRRILTQHIEVMGFVLVTEPHAKTGVHQLRRQASHLREQVPGITAQKPDARFVRLVNDPTVRLRARQTLSRVAVAGRHAVLNRSPYLVWRQAATALLCDAPAA